MEQTHKIKAVIGAGLAVLLGVGIAAVSQTYVWGNSDTQVARAYEALNRLDSIAWFSKAAEEASLRFAATSDGAAATECRKDLSDARDLMAGINAAGADRTTPHGPALQASRRRLAELLDEQYVSFRSALDAGAPGGVANVLAGREASGARIRLQNAIQEMRAQLRETLDERLDHQADTADKARLFFVSSGLLCCVLIVMAGWQFSLDLGHNETKGAAMRQTEYYREAVELATDMVFRLDAEGRIVYCNPAALQLLHYSEQEAIGRSYTKVVRMDMRREVEHFYMRQIARKRKSSYHEIPIIDGHGRERWIGQNVQVLMQEGKIAGFQGIARDLTERKRAEADLARRFSFVEGIAATAPGLLYVFDLVDRKTVFANRELAVTLGYEPEPGSDFDQVAMRLFHPDDLSALRMHHESLRRALEGEVQRIEYRARHADGHWLWLSAWETPLTRDPDGKVRQIVGIAQDVTAHNAARDRLTWQANYDTLTRLANRHHFWTCLQNLLRRADREHMSVALCVFDVDRFKDINDQFGHAAGDEVLEAVGAIVRSELSPEDPSGRLGGDEFCFVLKNAEHEEVARLAERMRERLNTMAFGMHGGSPFTASATFGVAAWQTHMSARELVEAADRALYRAKASGRNRVCVEV